MLASYKWQTWVWHQFINVSISIWFLLHLNEHVYPHYWAFRDYFVFVFLCFQNHNKPFIIMCTSMSTSSDSLKYAMITLGVQSLWPSPGTTYTYSWLSNVNHPKFTLYVVSLLKLYVTVNHFFQNFDSNLHYSLQIFTSVPVKGAIRIGQRAKKNE